MKMQNDKTWKMTEIQRNSAINSNKENGQITLENNQQQIYAQNSNLKIRCHSGNISRSKKLSGNIYTEQAILSSLKTMGFQNSSNTNSKNDFLDLQQFKKQKSTIECLDTISSSQALNESVTKQLKKRVVVSALKIRPEIVKDIEEEIDNLDCESIVNQELKKYRCLRTDSIVDNQINKEELLKELQMVRRSISGMSVLSNNKSNHKFQKQEKQEIKKIQNSSLKQSTQHFETEEESPDLKVQTSFQKALTEFEEEMNQLNMNCRKRYDQNRRSIVQRKGLPQKQNQNQNVQYLSSEDDQDISNAECLIQLIQNGTSGNLQKQNNQILKKDSDNQKNSINLQRSKNYKIKESKQNKINQENTPSQKLVESSTGNFAIFKNQYLKQMQSQSAAKTNFTKQESLLSNTDLETNYSKQHSVQSIQKNSCDSDEILDDKDKISFLLPSQTSLSKSSSVTTETSIFTELSLSSNRLPTQKHQEYLDKSCGSLLNVFKYKNTYIPTNNQDSLSQLTDSQNRKYKNRKNKSVTPMKSSSMNSKTTNNCEQKTQSKLISSQLRLSLEPIEKQNKSVNEGDSQNYKLSDVLINDKNIKQGENQNGSINNFRQKFLKKVINDIHAQRNSKKESDIGDNNNNTFQIRKIPIHNQQNEYLDLSMQMSASANKSFYNGVKIPTSQKINILNIENNQLKQNKSNLSSTNFTANQEKLNKLLKRKYKNSQSKKCSNNENQNKKIQKSHSQDFKEQDEEFNFTRNMFDSSFNINKQAFEVNPLSKSQHIVLKA